jgi:hypothetical protein
MSSTGLTWRSPAFLIVFAILIQGLSASTASATSRSGLELERVVRTQSRRVSSDVKFRLFGVRCPSGKRIASGGYSLVSVKGNVTLEDLRVLAALPDTAEQSYKIHVSNAGPRSRGAAPLVTVQLVALCY